MKKVEEEDIERLRARADQLRAQFFATVDALGDRERRVVRAIETLPRRVPMVLVAGVLVVSAAGATAYLFASAPTRARRRRRRRWAALLPFRKIIVVRGGDAREERRGPALVRELLVKLAVAALSAPIAEIATTIAPLLVMKGVKKLAA